MGQRHQIYVNFPENLGMAGFHHQWLYGMTVIESLARVLKFYQASDEYSPLKTNCRYGLDRQSEVINSLYSVDIGTGYWHYVHNFIQEKNLDPITDPRLADNNDGITIIDLSKGNFRYCLMSIGHLEGEVNPKPFKPLTAREYLLCYYPKFLDKKGKRGNDIDQEIFDRVLSKLLFIEEKAKVLTLSECKKLFPKMYVGAPK